MKVTMLYFSTIRKMIKENGYTWTDVENIKDYEGRVKIGNLEYTLEFIFYSTHMNGFEENGKYEKILTEAFLNALKEVRNNRIS